MASFRPFPSSFLFVLFKSSSSLFLSHLQISHFNPLIKNPIRHFYIFHSPSMSPRVCQGLQTCLEPGLVEQRAIAPRLVSPKPHLFHRTESHPVAAIVVSAPNTTEQQCDHKNIDSGTFASVCSLIQNSEQSYHIQPPLRTTSLTSRLSSRSLELYTENLGCETGTDLIKTDFFSHSSCSSNPNGVHPSKVRERVKLRHRSAHKKENSWSFPPPLTSISGQSSIHMKPHREGGRLVVKAVTVPSTHACLQAERGDGRLRLRLVNKNPPTEAAVEVQGGREEDGESKVSENGSAATEDARKEGGGVCLGMNKRRNGNENDESGEIGTGKYQRPGRCKEGGPVNLEWKPFWVATS